MCPLEKLHHTWKGVIDSQSSNMRNEETFDKIYLNFKLVIKLLKMSSKLALPLVLFPSTLMPTGSHELWEVMKLLPQVKC